jgi:hypothetical protein
MRLLGAILDFIASIVARSPRKGDLLRRWDESE